MVNRKVILAALLVTAVLGLGMFAAGLTGMATYDQYTKQSCTLDTDCFAPEKCCLFYGEGSGICHKEDMCASITALTKEEKRSIDEERELILKPAEEKSNYMAGMIMGLIIFILMAYAIYVELQHNREIAEARRN